MSHWCARIAAALALLLVASTPAAGRSVLVAEPQADPGLAPLTAGTGLWLARRLEAAGFAVEPASPGASQLGRVLEEATATGTAYALLPSIRWREQQVELRLQVFVPGSGELAAAARARAPLATVGNAYEQAAFAVLRALGIPPSRLANAPPPLLDELASSGRALAWIERGELSRAWREVEGKLSPTAMSLRNAIVDSARHTDTPLAERARVLAVSGDERAAWSLIADSVARQASADAPDRKLLLAAVDVQLARNNPRGAHGYLERLVHRHARDAEVQIGLGVAYALQSNPRAARQAFELAAGLEPDSVRPWRLLEETLADDPPARARALVQAGEREARHWNLRRAERLFSQASEVDPAAAADAWRGRGRMHQAVGRQAEALAAWDAARAAGAGDAEVWTGLGSAQRALGDPAAQASLERALELEPNHAGALTELGQLHVEFGRAQVAATYLRRAVAADPRGAGSRRALARALARSGKPDEALDVLVGPQAPEPGSAETLRQAAALQRELGDLEGAQQSLRRAIALEPADAESHRDLATLSEDLGDPAGAEGARRLAAILSGETQSGPGEASPGQRTAVLNLDELALSFAGQIARPHQRRVAHLGVREPRDWRVLALRWLQPREPDLEALEAALVHALGLRFAFTDVADVDSPIFRERVDQLYAFERRSSLDAQTIADVNGFLDTDAVFVSRLIRLPDEPEDLDGVSRACADPQRFELELRMLSGQHAELASILMDVECIAGGLGSVGTWNRRAAAIYAVMALILLFPILRGWGSLVVEIKLPPKTRGFLRIRIARRPQEAGSEEAGKGKRRTEGRLKRSLNSFSRYRKHMAGRETVFRWIPARPRAYYVTVSGPLFDALGDEQIGHFLEEQRVRISRGKVARLSYDFNPNEVTVQVTVLWNGEPCRNARVALRDDAGSMRYARDGTAFFYCPKGVHTVCAGALDRATERPVEIRSLESAVTLTLDLGEDAGLMVRASEAAVEPYLLGDFGTAAAALDAVGEAQLAHVMRGAYHQQRGELQQAADEFEAAGCIEEAAELRASGDDHDASATLFEQAGDYARAADAHRAAGKLADAARCYEAAYDFESAIECYESAGDFDKVIDLHEKTGAYMDAATVAHERGDLERALHSLQQVERRDPVYGEACGLAAEILAQRAEYDLAAEKLQAAIEMAGGESAPLELHERLAQMLEQGQDPRGALEAYETIRRRDPGRQDVTQHIAALRQELGNDASDAVTQRAEPRESRYEILGELGRGGMGVVLKARDTRLGRIVALKRLPENLRDNQAAAQLFLREARAAASLNHPNIVTVYDAGEENGVYHITMELLEGRPVNAIQEQRGVIGPRDTARLALQVCAGLQYAHEQRIVHRDIKTANLFFTNEKVVKIMDFGLAKTIEEVRKNSTVIGGTPYYMAPEQAAGQAVDNRTDLYALGVTLYRLVSGTFPFTEGDLAYHHRHTPPPDPREHGGDLPAGMAELILALLAKDPAQRPRDAAEVATRIRAVFSS